MGKQYCQYCQKQITGRSDKKFCDHFCRNAFHNQDRNQEEQEIIKINKTIRKNRRILKDLCPSGKGIIRKEVMDSLGYNYECFSSLFITKQKKVYYICYDYAFCPLEEKGIKKALIVTKQDYMKGWDPWKFVRKE